MGVAERQPARKKVWLFRQRYWMGDVLVCWDRRFDRHMVLPLLLRTSFFAGSIPSTPLSSGEGERRGKGGGV